jgi:hypothetical protein
MPQNPQICPTTIHLCRLRVTRLVASGAVASPPNNAYVTGSSIKLDYGIDVTDGEEKQLVTGCDTNRVTYRGADKFKRFTFGLDLAALEPALVEMMTGAALILDSSTIPVPIGFNWPLLNSAPPPVAIEAWVDNWIDDAQAATPFRYTRYVWPMTFWRPDDGTLENEFKTESLSGYSRSNSLWGNGPYGDQVEPGTVTPKAITAMGGVIFSDTMPASVCGYKATTSGSL